MWNEPGATVRGVVGEVMLEAMGNRVGLCRPHARSRDGCARRSVDDAAADTEALEAEVVPGGSPDQEYGKGEWAKVRKPREARQARQAAAIRRGLLERWLRRIRPAAVGVHRVRSRRRRAL